MKQLIICFILLITVHSAVANAERGLGGEGLHIYSFKNDYKNETIEIIFVSQLQNLSKANEWETNIKVISNRTVYILSIYDNHQWIETGDGEIITETQRLGTGEKDYGSWLVKPNPVFFYDAMVWEIKLFNSHLNVTIIQFELVWGYDDHPPFDIGYNDTEPIVENPFELPKIVLPMTVATVTYGGYLAFKKSKNSKDVKNSEFYVD